MLSSNYNFMVYNWLGKIESKDGVATFLIDQEKFQFNLESFKEFEKINDLATLAFKKGMRMGKEKIKNELKKIVKELIV